MLDSVIKASKKYYPQKLLEECKYEIKKTKMENQINLMMNLTMYLIMRLNLITDLTMKIFLKLKTVF